MLGNAHFYHQLTRKAVILFGRMFDDISIIRKLDNGKEQNRFIVPIVYAPKEKMITRVLSDPDLLRQTQAILPRMSFEITGISYDATRKQNNLLKASKLNTSTKASSAYVGVPYDINFQLVVYARNIDDGTHIVEQIMPFFNPDFTISTNMVPSLGSVKDIPIIMNSISNDIQYEGNFDSVRYVYWTLNFTMKMHYYGPVANTSIIRKIFTNIYDDSTMGTDILKTFNVTGANGVFKVDDTIFQGSSILTATATATVAAFSANTGRLVITSPQGTFKINTAIHAVSTNGYCVLSSFDVSPSKIVEIKIEPDPITANAGSDYGYTTTIIEWPNTEL
jgi:hypothetical protein